MEDKEHAAELIYDELKMLTDFKLRVEEDKLLIEIVKHKMNLDSRYSVRETPKKETIGMSNNEY